MGRRFSGHYTTTPFGEIARIAHSLNGTPFWTLDYTWNAIGRLTERRETRRGNDGQMTSYVWSYAYDALGRLVETKLEGQTMARYGYDLQGNRIMEDQGGGEQTAVVDAQDRLLSCGSREFGHDAQGRRTWASCNGRETNYAYNGLGSLTDIALPDGRQIGYVYDGAGRRVGKRIDGVLQRGWLYEDGLRIAAELDGNQAVTSEFFYGASPNVPEGMEKGGRTYRLLTDHLGSVNYVVDALTGAVVQEMQYDEWGKVLKDTNPGFQPFGYAGGLYDPDTGLVRFGARDYDPREGRWTTKDPIGLAGGWNVYAYTENSPVITTDPEGLMGRGPGKGPYAPGQGPGTNAGRAAATGAAIAGSIFILPEGLLGVGATRAVTHWGPKGVCALRDGDWVMTGGNSVRNWVMSGSPEKGYELGSSVTEAVSSESLSFPGGWEWIKGLLGQRIFRQ